MEAAIWARVSTTEQETENQLRQLREAAVRRDLEVVEPVYVAEASAWKGAHRRQLERALANARAGRFDVLLCWALDRLTREGPLETLQVVDRLAKAGVQVVSLQESWTEAAGELRDLLLAIVGWVARFESTRRSERTKLGWRESEPKGAAAASPSAGRHGSRSNSIAAGQEVRDLVLSGVLTKREGARRLRVRYDVFTAALARPEKDQPVPELEETA